MQHSGPNLQVCVWGGGGGQHGFKVENEKSAGSATFLGLYGNPGWTGMRYI